MEKLTAYWLALLMLLGCQGLVGSSSSEAAPTQLNSLVSELMHVESLAIEKEGQQISFENPRDGWVYIETAAHLAPAAELDVALADDTLTRHHLPGQSRQEAMRWLAAGKYVLRIRAGGPNPGTLEITVRAIPQLAFGSFRYLPWIKGFGKYDWAFLEKHVHPNINCMLGGADIETDGPYIKKWKAQKKKWLIHHTFPAEDDPTSFLMNLAHAADGVYLDELGPEFSGKVDEWEAAFMPENLGDWETAKQTIVASDKEFLTYCYDLVPGKNEDLPAGTAPVTVVSSDRGKAYIQSTITLGQKIGWERYLHEMPDEQSAANYIKSGLKGHLKVWESAVPGVRNHMVLVLSQLVMPTYESDNTYPEVNWKYFMDMQCHLIANDPVFKGLFGIEHYTCGYATEEIVRWNSALYRHYFIEGNTEMLSDRYGYKYLSGHITNPDFDQELKGWTLQPAEEGSIAVKSMAGYGKFQGRRRSGDKGDTFLWTHRSTTAPNQVSQTMRHLIPGRLYSVKMITGDYAELVNGKASQGLNGISIRIKGVDIFSDRSFVQPQASRNKFNAFDRDNPYCFNFHWVVFRAKAETAELTISDWANQKEPGGAIGQELIYNFIEVQPYFDDSIPQLK